VLHDGHELHGVVPPALMRGSTLLANSTYVDTDSSSPLIPRAPPVDARAAGLGAART